MLENEMVAIIGQWGIASLFFIMWWHERRDKKGNAEAAMGWKAVADELVQRRDVLIDVVKANTEAMVALRDEVNRIREHCERINRA